MLSKLTLAVFFFTSAIHAFSQVVPAAEESGHLTLDAGAGLSYYYMDYGPGHELGGTLWVDATPHIGPHFLQGLGAELEARDLSLDPEKPLSSRFRTDTAGGGPIYTVQHFRNFKPFVKFIVSYGSIDYSYRSRLTPNVKYGHLTWGLNAPGGGLDYRVHNNFWVRADYEYQSWINLFDNHKDLNPDGFTFGAVYELNLRHSR
jgi:hypothetical protein